MLELQWPLQASDILIIKHNSERQACPRAITMFCPQALLESHDENNRVNSLW